MPRDMAEETLMPGAVVYLGHRVTFKYKPLDSVCITAYELRCRGRVMCCIHDRGGEKYEVEYALNGEIKRREFYEDELSE